jgi:hypothetical protein
MYVDQPPSLTTHRVSLTTTPEQQQPPPTSSRTSSSKKPMNTSSGISVVPSLLLIPTNVNIDQYHRCSSDVSRQVQRHTESVAEVLQNAWLPVASWLVGWLVGCQCDSRVPSYRRVCKDSLAIVELLSIHDNASVPVASIQASIASLVSMCLSRNRCNTLVYSLLVP